MSIGIEPEHKPGITPAVTNEAMEYQTQVLRSALREVRDVEPIEVANFLKNFLEEESPSPRKVADELGLKWIAIYRAIYAVPELEDFWESVVHSKSVEAIFEARAILEDDELSMTDRKAKSSALMQWAKMVNPKMYGDKGGDINLNLNLGDTIDKARIRVTKMKQQVILAADPVEDAGL